VQGKEPGLAPTDPATPLSQEEAEAYARAVGIGPEQAERFIETVRSFGSATEVTTAQIDLTIAALKSGAQAKPEKPQRTATRTERRAYARAVAKRGVHAVPGEQPKPSAREWFAFHQAQKAAKDAPDS
jgi:hypothetical protein